MDLVTELWDLEKIVFSVEEALLNENSSEANNIIKSLSSTSLRELICIDEAIDRMQSANDRDYCQYGHWGIFNFHWNEYDEGYCNPVLSNPTGALPSFVSHHLWYFQMTAHGEKYDFVRSIMHRMNWQRGREEGKPYEGLPELLALSTLRKHLREFWERLVRDIVFSRHRTPLESVARLLRLRLAWVHKISENSMNYINRTDKLLKDEMVYLCSDPDYSLKPLVDLPEPPEAKVVYFVVCPACKHHNEQGKTTCEHCGAPL